MPKENYNKENKEEVTPEFRKMAEEIYEKHRKIFEELAKH